MSKKDPLYKDIHDPCSNMNDHGQTMVVNDDLKTFDNDVYDHGQLCFDHGQTTVKPWSNPYHCQTMVKSV